MWQIIIAVVLISLAAGTVYLTAVIAGTATVKKIAGEKKALRALVSFLLIAAAFAAASLLLSPINAVVMTLFVVLFSLLYGLAFRIVRRITGKKDGYNPRALLALISAAIYLAVGYYLCVSVVQTDYELTTDKLPGGLRIALIADSHIGTTFDGDGFAEHLKTIEAQSPDVLLIAGDFVDDWSDREDMLRACEALGQTDIKYGIYYVYGNHDSGHFSDRDFSRGELAEALEANGVRVLEDSYILVDDRFYVAGRLDGSFRQRADMDELLEGIDKDKYIILLDHQPSDYENEAGKADLVLSGHTHGGQMIPITYVGVLSGAVDREYGHENREGTDFIVTSGISCWEVLFKTGTRSEYVIIDVNHG